MVRFSSVLAGLFVCLYVVVLPTTADDRTGADRLFEQAQKAREQRQADKAIELFSKAIQMNPRFDKAYFWRGYVYYELKANLSRATDDWAVAIRLKPSNGEYLFYGGIGYCWGKNDFARARDCFDKAIATAPNCAEYIFQRGRCYADNGMRDRGIADISKAIDLRPDSAMYWLTRGRYYHMQRDFAAARRDFLKTIELEPTGQWADEARRRIAEMDKACQ